MGKQANKYLLFIYLDKCFFLTFGPLGVHLAKLQWHTTNTYWRQEAKTGVIKSDSSVSQSTIKWKLLRSTLKIRIGPVLSTTTFEPKVAQQTRTTEYKVFLTFCLSTKVGKLFLLDILLRETLKRILILCCKEKYLLVRAQASVVKNKVHLLEIKKWTNKK
jgi:hypothetical protein